MCYEVWDWVGGSEEVATGYALALALAMAMERYGR